VAVSDAQIGFVNDLFADLGDISTRKMMGGLCIYANGQIFALIGDQARLYIKAKGALAQEFATAGSEIFSYDKKNGKTGSMGYWTLPEAALDDPELACDWARKSLNSNR
jgi:DNA transformation protein and related proteins